MLQLLFAVLLPALEPEGVDLLDVRDLLVFSVDDLPFLLKCADQFLALLIWEQELGLVAFVLLLNLHLADELVLVFDLSLDLLHVFWNLAVSILFQKVFILVNW